MICSLMEVWVRIGEWYEINNKQKLVVQIVANMKSNLLYYDSYKSRIRELEN